VAITQTRVVGPTTLGASSAVLYTPSAGQTVIIKQVSLTNYTSTSKTVDLWLLPTTITTVGDAYLVLKSFALNGYETVFLNLSLVMVGAASTNGDRLHALASSASSVNVIISGIVET